ncbi:hypothetical protein CPC08DRAFT_824589 [Agrocybe pediades]|nr:hypothetical protein CPC08DRAFT_824589 [Agrocybe pediades]
MLDGDRGTSGSRGSTISTIRPNDVPLARRNGIQLFTSLIGDLIPPGVKSVFNHGHEPTQSQSRTQPPPQTTNPTEPHSTLPPSTPTPVFITITTSPQAPAITAEPSIKSQSGVPPKTITISNPGNPDKHILGGASSLTSTVSQAIGTAAGTQLLSSTTEYAEQPQQSDNSPSPSQQSDTQTSPKHGQPIGIAIGVGIGIFFVLVLLASAILLIIRRTRRRKQLRRKEDEEGSFKSRWSYHGSTWSGSEVTGVTGDVYFPPTVPSSSVRSPRTYSDIFSIAATSMTQQSYHGSKSRVNR